MQKVRNSNGFIAWETWLLIWEEIVQKDHVIKNKDLLEILTNNSNDSRNHDKFLLNIILLYAVKHWKR